jgi:hypothetical protein
LGREFFAVNPCSEVIEVRVRHAAGSEVILPGVDHGDDGVDFSRCLPGLEAKLCALRHGVCQCGIAVLGTDHEFLVALT